MNRISSDIPAPRTAVAMDAAHLAESTERAGCVLVVDDNPISQLVTLQQLRELGCTALLASNGVEALATRKAEQLDLILLDCRMPGIDGYQTARAIRTFEHDTQKPRVAMVAVTGDNDVECVDKCLSAGMDGHLSKPTSVDALRDLLVRYLP